MEDKEWNERMWPKKKYKWKKKVKMGSKKGKIYAGEKWVNKGKMGAWRVNISVHYCSGEGWLWQKCRPLVTRLVSGIGLASSVSLWAGAEQTGGAVGPRLPGPPGPARLHGAGAGQGVPHGDTPGDVLVSIETTVRLCTRCVNVNDDILKLCIH